MNTLATATPDTVLALLRRLTPRERLHVLAQALPELEHELPTAPMAVGFWRGISMQALIEQQNVHPANDFDALLSGWPPDETVDDFIKAVHESRQQYPAEVDTE
jgi:hypothetical protein